MKYVKRHLQEESGICGVTLQDPIQLGVPCGSSETKIRDNDEQYRWWRSSGRGYLNRRLLTSPFHRSTIDFSTSEKFRHQ